MGPLAVVSRRGADRIAAGHPWIYRSDILSVEAEPGDLVRVTGENKRPLGVALYSSRSQIAIRMMTGATGAAGASGATGADERSLFRERLLAAIDYRQRLGIDATAYRLVNGEADRLPALIVDRYSDYLVVQTLCQGTDRRLELIVDLLGELLTPRGILARNDVRVRALEGLDARVEVVRGEVPDRVDVREGPLTFSADLRRGQKTGLFLDQRENHAAAARLATGRGLDAFAYQGGFALSMASGCSHVLALDSSGPAVAATRAHAAANGISHVEVREVNVFDELRELEVSGARFETIVLDPPAFAKNKASVERALSGYKEINLRALKLLTPGGHLVTCSCSYNVDETLFLDVVTAAAIDARATVALVEKRMQARDHPVLIGVPETHYLKCLVLRRVA